MRLLDVTKEKLVSFPDSQVPEYAILSHTWLQPNEREVSYLDFQESESKGFRHKDGFSKVRFTCDKAILDGIKYVWIDILCINKRDPVELSKAINSMFRYYMNSSVCYVYLTDVLCEHVLSPKDSKFEPESTSWLWLENFASSRWFKRGWTLQELIAPSAVIFFGANGESLGTRNDLADTISRVTRIDPIVLRGEISSRYDILSLFSMAQRLAWGAVRETTEPEDIAYSLLGIVGVYLTPQYGEGGSEAFQRLQQAILKSKSDQSVLAWSGEYGGLFATSPAAYQNCENIVSLPMAASLPALHDLKDGGLRISAKLVDLRNLNLPCETLADATHALWLNCGYQGRRCSVPCLLLKSSSYQSLEGETICYSVGVRAEYSL